ncbi:MAG: UvrD-helicase domain-containing protein, partial [Planctomycetota bacterium]
ADAAHPCAIDRVLVVTFTRAAAAELRVRIARELHEQAARTADPQVRRHLRRQELLVEGAEIGTIDAWCGRLVREHFAEAEVDLRLRTLSDEDARLLRREVLDSLFTGIHRGTEPLAEEARAWIARAPKPDDDFLRRLVAGLSRYREHLVNPDEWFARQAAVAEAGATDPARALADAQATLALVLAEECAFQHDQLTRLLDEQPDVVRAVLARYRAALAGWCTALADPTSVAGVAAQIADFAIPKPARSRNAPSEPPLVAEVRKRWLAERLQKLWAADAVEAMLKQAPQTAALARTLLRLEARYHELLTDTKRRQAVCEFGDILRVALDLLGTAVPGGRREPTDVARRLQERYEHILVDEYQDTSPVQVEILRLVTRPGPGRTNRFMVGDVKQSIYGFREAEPRLFSELTEALVAGACEGRVEYLSDNFRSHADLLAALNLLFERLFDRALGGTPYGAKERLRAGRAAGDIPNPTLPAPRVAVHVIENESHRGQNHDAADADSEDDSGEVIAPELIEREAQLAADEIRRLLASGAQVPERGENGVLRLRPLKLADIVILLRSAVKNAGLVAGVLRRNGLHCITSGRESLLDSLEVQDVCSVLKLLVNRRQDVPLAAYLRGPLVGLSAADLLAIVQHAGPTAPEFFTAVTEYRRARPAESLAVRLDAAMNQLDAWAVAAREEELPALLRRIFHDTGLVLLARALHGGEHRVALLRSLQTFAASFAGGLQAAVDDFLAYLTGLAEEEIEPGALAAADEDVVRIMTIHGAKGLEFPVVFLLGAGAKFNTLGQRAPLQCDEQLGLGLKFADYEARAALVSPRQHVIACRVAQRDLAEELRLLYVAATRAREQLYIVGHAKPGAWAACCELYGGQTAPPPLIARMCVHHRLEWVLMAAGGVAGMSSVSGLSGGHAVARAEDHDAPLLSITTHAPDEIPVASAGRIQPSPTPPAPGATEPPVSATAEEPAWQPEDAAWLDRAAALLTADIDSVHADFPAMMSVSALKELALREPADDRPTLLDAAAQPLPIPAFAAPADLADGRALGTACHRFLELADFTRLGRPIDVQLQARELVAAKRMDAAQADLLPTADVAWLAGTPEGKLLARAGPAARRELPFVYALRLGESGERTIVRGVIDCLIERPDGLVLIDYKSDRVRDDADLRERLAGYQVQLQVYARAAEAIFARPVTRAVLIFLRARRIIDVPLTAPRLEALLNAAHGAARP